MKILKYTLSGAALFATFIALTTPAFAFEPRPADDDEEENGEDSKDDEDAESWFAITNGDVHTGTGAVLRGVTILAKNGVIQEIGHGVFLPEETETLDAMGMRVYPGLVALNATTQISSGLFSSEGPDELSDPHDLEDSHFGLDDVHTDPFTRSQARFGHVEIDEGDEHDEHVDGDGDDHTESSDTQAGDLALRSKIEDSFDPFSQYLVLALATGITTAEQSGAALKLRRGEIDDVLLKERNLVSMSWGVSNPSGTRKTREKFKAAAEHRRAMEAWNELSESEKKETKEPKKPSGFDPSAYSVLTGELMARFDANERQDLIGIAALAQQYKFRPVIWGCGEGWTVAGELGRAGAYAVVTPRARSPKNENVLRAGGTSIENAAILHEHGVQVAIRPQNTRFDLGGITGRDLLHLPVEAAFGVRGGLPEEAALAGISLIPARILGVDHRVGTLEVGKDLDAIVMNGDVLHYQTFVEWTVVSGKLVYDKQEEIFFAHIRPRPEPAKTAAEDDDEAAPEEDADESDPDSDEDSEAEDDEDDEDEAGEDGSGEVEESEER